MKIVGYPPNRVSDPFMTVLQSTRMAHLGMYTWIPLVESTILQIIELKHCSSLGFYPTGHPETPHEEQC